MYLGITEKIVIAVLMCIAVAGGLHIYGSYKYKQGVSDTKQEQYVAQLEQFKQQTLDLDRASKQLLSITEQLNTQVNEWKFNYDEIANKEPLHPDCVISASRLLNINSAIEQATSTRKPIGTMPADRKIK